MNEVILTFAIAEDVPDHLQDHVPYLRWNKRKMRQDSYTLVNRQVCRRGYCRGDRDTWRGIGHLDDLRDHKLRELEVGGRIGKVVQENQGKRDMGRVIYRPNVSWRVR